MKQETLINKTIELIGCDKARISSPGSTHFMIIGYRRNTKEDSGQWVQNGKTFDFDYFREYCIASGETYGELWEDVEKYAELINNDKVVK